MTFVLVAALTVAGAHAVAAMGALPDNPSKAPGLGFVTLGSIAGDATDPDHSAWIELVALRKGIENDGVDDGKAGTSPLNIGIADRVSLRATVAVDAATPELMRHAMVGARIPTATVHLTTPVGEKQVPYLIISLEHVFVTDTTLSFHETVGSVLGLALHYERVHVEHRTLAEDGKTVASESFGFDRAAGTPWAP